MLQKAKLKIINMLPRVLHKDFHNVLANLSNYKTTPKPRYVHFEITYRCTCKCSFCSRWEIGPVKVKEELTTKEIILFLKEAIGMGITGISFSGGEPFIRNDIFEIASFCKKAGLFVHVNSNGTLIAEHNYREINRFMDSILISVDSDVAEIHDNLRGVSGTFEKAMKALDLIDKSKIQVQMVINSKNIDHLYDYISFMSTKANRIRLQPIHNNPENMFTINDSKLVEFENLTDKWNTFIEKLKGSGLELDGTEKYYELIPFFLTDPLSLKGKIDCFMGSHAFFLDPYGNIVPCEGIRKPFGNIREQKLVEIWKGANSFRKKFNKKKTRPCVCMYSCLENDIIFWNNFFSLKKIKYYFP